MLGIRMCYHDGCQTNNGGHFASSSNLWCSILLRTKRTVALKQPISDIQLLQGNVCSAAELPEWIVAAAWLLLSDTDTLTTHNYKILGSRNVTSHHMHKLFMAKCHEWWIDENELDMTWPMTQSPPRWVRSSLPPPDDWSGPQESQSIQAILAERNPRSSTQSCLPCLRTGSPSPTASGARAWWGCQVWVVLLKAETCGALLAFSHGISQRFSLEIGKQMNQKKQKNLGWIAIEQRKEHWRSDHSLLALAFCSAMVKIS